MSKLKIKTKERRFETARDLYGIFFEDINRAGDGRVIYSRRMASM